VFRATEKKFKSIEFETVDLTNPGGPGDKVAEQYGVQGPPFLVLLDGQGKVLWNGLPPFTREDLESLIRQYQ
jgi:hypothetical protein